MLWKIEFMKTLTHVAQGYVVECGWRCIATQDNHSANAYGGCSFPAPADAQGDFIPYEKLTEAQVLGWCWDSGVDKAEVEANLTKQLADKLNPPIVNKPLPWAA